MYRVFQRSCDTQGSRLHKLPQAAVMFISIVLARHQLANVEALLAAEPPNTYVAALPQDIRRYILEPYFWSGRRFCGVPHRDGYTYGVPHGKLQTNYNTCAHYNMGLIHRVGAPAVEGLQYVIYQQHNRRYRESGPLRVAPDKLVFGRTSIIQEVYTNFSNSQHMKLRNGIHLRLTSTARFEVTLNVPRNRNHSKYRAFHIYDDHVMISSDSATTVVFQTPIFAELIRELLAFLLAYDIVGSCEREWKRSQAEIIANQ